MRVEDKFASSVMCSETNSMFEGGQTHEVLLNERKKKFVSLEKDNKTKQKDFEN